MPSARSVTTFVILDSCDRSRYLAYLLIYFGICSQELLAE